MNCLRIDEVLDYLIDRDLGWTEIIEFHAILVFLLKGCLFCFFLFCNNCHFFVIYLILFFTGWFLKFQIGVLLAYNWWSITDLWNVQNFIPIFWIGASARGASGRVFALTGYTTLDSQIVIFFDSNVLIEIIASIRKLFLLLFNSEFFMDLFLPFSFKLFTFWIREIGGIIHIKTDMFCIFKQSNSKLQINCCKILLSKYVCSELKYVINIDINTDHWSLVLDFDVHLLLIDWLLIYLVEFSTDQWYF